MSTCNGKTRAELDTAELDGALGPHAMCLGPFVRRFVVMARWGPRCQLVRAIWMHGYYELCQFPGPHGYVFAAGSIEPLSGLRNAAWLPAARTRLSEHLCLGANQLDAATPYMVTKCVSMLTAGWAHVSMVGGVDSARSRGILQRTPLKAAALACTENKSFAEAG